MVEQQHSKDIPIKVSKPAHLVPPHRNHSLVIQNNVVARVLIVRIIHTALEHGAVYPTGVAFVAA